MAMHALAPQKQNLDWDAAGLKDQSGRLFSKGTVSCRTVHTFRSVCSSVSNRGSVIAHQSVGYQGYTADSMVSTTPVLLKTK
jgi:hypothetical protein